jgi:PAS domain S-box-containing protein
MVRKVLNNRESIERQNMHIQISERRYRDLVQALPDVVFTLDHEGFFTFVNESVRGFGYEPVELIGKHFSFILDPEDISRVSRREILKTYSGINTGPEKAPKLFDERRTGNRKTSDLEVKLKPKQDAGAGNAAVSVISYGEVSTVGFSSLDRETKDPGSAGIIRDITGRKKAENLLRDSLREKEILLKEIHHRVKNNLQIITSLLSLQSTYIRDPEDLRLFEDSQMQVRSMAMVHEQLYQSERLSRINMRIYLRSLCEKLYDVYHVSPARVALDLDAEELFYDVEAATPVALLVNELVSNSLKYAFPDNRQGTVTVRLRKEEAACSLLVADDGVGLSEDLALADSRTLGCRLITALVDQISGSIEHLPGPGTAFIVGFPYKDSPIGT